MEAMISVKYPEFLAETLRLNREDFDREMKIASVVKLFENQRISSGIAAQVLGISRVEFLEILSANHVQFLHSESISEDFENA